VPPRGPPPPPGPAPGPPRPPGRVPVPGPPLRPPGPPGPAEPEKPPGPRPPTGRGGMLLGLGRGPPGRGPPGRGPSAGPVGPERPGNRDPPGRGAPGPGRPADWPVPGGAAKAAEPPPPAAPGAPGWPGRAPRGADPIPVAVELNGLLPGRGPGRGGPGVPAAGRGAPGPGRGAAGLGAAGAPGDGVASVPAPGAVPSAAAGAAGWPCGNGTGGLVRSGDSPGCPPAAGVPAAGLVTLGGSAGLSTGPGAAGAAGTAGPWPFTPLCGSLAATPSAAGGAATLVAAATTPAAGAPAPDAAAAAWPSWALPRACLGCWVANASLSLRTTGASIVEDADRTNSPISWSLAITALLSTPNSFASSYTRTFATALPLLGPARPDPQPVGAARAPSGVSFCCSSPHAHRSLIAISACSPGPSCPGPAVRAARGAGPGSSGLDSARYSASLPVPSGPGTRSARANARRRCACSKHPWQGCRYAPRPGLRAGASGTTSFPAATTRSKSDLAARDPHPTQVRSAGACRA
jgi:hypothetical protein